MSKYLDYNGAQKLWDKVKLWVQTRLNAKADKEHTHDQYHQDGQDYAMINHYNEFTFVPDGFGGETGNTVYFNYRTKGGTNGNIKDYAFGNGHGGTLGHLATREWSNGAYAAKSHSHSYNDLTDKPTIPSAVTVDSALSGTSTNPVQNKVVSAALADKADMLELLYPAPKLIIRKWRENENLYVDHRLIGSTGVEVVLMVYQRRNSKLRSNDGGDTFYTYSKKGWAVAEGDSSVFANACAFVKSTPSFPRTVVIPLTEIREHIIRRYMIYSGYTPQQLAGRSYSDWASDTQTTDRGFTQTKNYGSHRTFGIALRWENPRFRRLVTGDNGDPSKTAIGNEPRYFYSQVAPLEAYLVSDAYTHNKRRMCFGLK